MQSTYLTVACLKCDHLGLLEFLAKKSGVALMLLYTNVTALLRIPHKLDPADDLSVVISSLRLALSDLEIIEPFSK